MEYDALGLIETQGLLPLIAAADAASKASDVKVLGYQSADAGIVTVYLAGDVSSVQAAVLSGEEAAKRSGCWLHSRVIARPDPEIWEMLGCSPNKSYEAMSIRELRAVAAAREDIALTPGQLRSMKKSELAKLLSGSEETRAEEQGGTKNEL